MKKSKTKEPDNIPRLNIGLVGHVDHGKTTLVQQLSGKWTDTHSEELKRGITIKLGYANTIIYKCPKCKPTCYTTKTKCPKCKSECIPLRKISFVDAPGHETLMATMLSGAAIMDAAILVIAANEECPRPQTREHLMALDVIGIKDIIIIQNKIDLVSKEEALKNYNQIKNFIKGTSAENAPIIPIAAQHGTNLDLLTQKIQENFKEKERDPKKSPLFLIARSFDVNKPGSLIKNLKGGVMGGALKKGILKIGDKIEIKPGIKIGEKWKLLETKIEGLEIGDEQVKEITPGGSAGILTKLDPSVVKADNLTGSVAGLKGKLPSVWHNFKLKHELLERAVGTKDELLVDPIKKDEVLMLNVNSAATVGVVTALHKNSIDISLKIPVCAETTDRITISRKLGDRWRLIGVGTIID